MKIKPLTFILLSIFILSACDHKETAEVVPSERNHTNQLTVEPTTVEPVEVKPSSNAPATLTYDVTVYLENESVTVTDSDKLIEITKNCIVPLPESERRPEPFRANSAKEEGLLIHIEYNYEIEFPVDFSSLSLDYSVTSQKGKRLYLAIGPYDWIGIQEKEDPDMFVAGFQSEENIVEILSCLELSEQQKEYILSLEPKITDPDFENDIIITAYSKGQEISVTDYSTLLYAAETCTDSNITFNTILYGDQLEELKSDELWINIYYNEGRNIYTPNSLCPITIKNMYIIIGEQNSISLQNTNGNFHSLIGITNNKAIETIRSCVALE